MCYNIFIDPFALKHRPIKQKTRNLPNGNRTAFPYFNRRRFLMVLSVTLLQKLMPAKNNVDRYVPTKKADIAGLWIYWSMF